MQVHGSATHTTADTDEAGYDSRRISRDDHSEDSDTVLPGLQPAASALALGPQEQKSAPHADVADDDRGKTRKKRQVVPKPPPREVASRRILLALADSDDADENNHDNMKMNEACDMATQLDSGSTANSDRGDVQAQSLSCISRQQPSAKTEHLSISGLMIENFKTFSRPTCISSFSEFTCIVGPNGAGKSSVLDAICFVFGSRTSELRGSTLSNLVNEDILRARQSANVPAEACVELTLRIDTSSRPHTSTFVRIARNIVVQPGESMTTRSEYRIDGQKSTRDAVRTRLLPYEIDINMQSRFVLLQSRTVQIIRQGPAELLDFLEECVGTHELRAQIESMREQETATMLQQDDADYTLQSTRAEREALRPEVTRWQHYRGLLIRFLSQRHALLQKQQLLGATTLKATTHMDKATQLFLQQGQVALEAAMSVHDEQRATVKALQSSASQARRLLTRNETQLNEAKVEAKKKSVQNRRQTKVIAESMSALQEVEVKLAETQELQQVADHDANQWQQKAKELQAELQSRLERASRERGGLKADTQTQLSRLEAILTEIQAQSTALPSWEKLKAQHEQAERKRQALQQSAAKAEAEHAQCISILADANTEQHSLRTIAARAKRDLESCQKQLQLHASGLVTALADLDDLRAKWSHGHAGRMRNAVHHLQQQCSGIHGLLCDLASCRCKEDEYAVHAALSSMLSITVVVNARSDAYQVMQHFRTERVGYVRCMILDELAASAKHRKPPQHRTMGSMVETLHRKHSAKIQPLLNALEFDRALYGPVFEMVCQNWVIVGDDQLAMHLSGASNGCNVATLQGRVFKSNGECIAGTTALDRRQKAASDLRILHKSDKIPSTVSTTAHANHSPANQVLAAEACVSALQTHISQQEHKAADATGARNHAEKALRRATAHLKRISARLHEAKSAATDAVRSCTAHGRRTKTIEGNIAKVKQLRDDTESTQRQLELLLCGGTSGSTDTIMQLRADTASAAAMRQTTESTAREAAATVRRLLKDQTKLQQRGSLARQKQTALAEWLKTASETQTALRDQISSCIEKENEATAAVTKLKENELLQASVAVKKAQRQHKKAQKDATSSQNIVEANRESLCAIKEHLASSWDAVQKQLVDSDGNTLQHSCQDLRQDLTLATAVRLRFSQQLNAAADTTGQDDLDGPTNVQSDEDAASVTSNADSMDTRDSVHSNEDGLAVQFETPAEEVEQDVKAVALLEAQYKDAEQQVDADAVARDAELEKAEATQNHAVQQVRQRLIKLTVERDELQNRRERQFTYAIRAINKAAAGLYRQLSVHGDFSLSAPGTLDETSMAEGVKMYCKETLSCAEWQSVEQLSGGQQALAALALTL
eukprot:SAG25_NODE_7_length_29214_cov_40.245818_31_plen_1355_part_00